MGLLGKLFGLHYKSEGFKKLITGIVFIIAGIVGAIVLKEWKLLILSAVGVLALFGAWLDFGRSKRF